MKSLPSSISRCMVNPLCWIPSYRVRLDACFLKFWKLMNIIKKKKMELGANEKRDSYWSNWSGNRRSFTSGLQRCKRNSRLAIRWKPNLSLGWNIWGMQLRYRLILVRVVKTSCNLTIRRRCKLHMCNLWIQDLNMFQKNNTIKNNTTTTTTNNNNSHTLELTVYDEERGGRGPPKLDMTLFGGSALGWGTGNSGAKFLIGWATGKGIACGSIPWPGGPDLGGNCCTGCGNWGWWIGGGSLTFIGGTPLPTCWKFWEATGMNSCEWGAGTTGRNCSIKIKWQRITLICH